MTSSQSGTVIFDVSRDLRAERARARQRKAAAELLATVKCLLTHLDDAAPGTAPWFDAAAARALVRRLETE